MIFSGGLLIDLLYLCIGFNPANDALYVWKINDCIPV